MWLVAKDAPSQPRPRPLLRIRGAIKTRDAWAFCLFYSVTFGGFVGLASFLNIFFHDQYGLTPIQARKLRDRLRVLGLVAVGPSEATWPIASGASGC